MPALFDSTRANARLLGEFVRHLRTLTPWRALDAVLSLALAQLFGLLAFLMPLKIILMVSEPTMPDYVSRWVAPELEHLFIIALSAAALLSYGLHHAFTRRAQTAIDAGAQRVLAATQKLQLFRNDEVLANDGYFRLARLGASLLMVLAAYGIGFWLNPLVFAILLALSAADYLVVSWLLGRGHRLGEQLRQLVDTRLNILAGVLGSINFLLVFAILVFQYLQAGGGSALVAIITLLLAREAMQRSTSALVDAGFILKNQARLRPLFFSSVPAPLPAESQEHQLAIAAFHPETRQQWLPGLLADVTGITSSDWAINWLDSNVPGGITLEARADGTDGDDNCFWLKCFPAEQTLRAFHEQHLFSTHHGGSLRLPAYVGKRQARDYHILVFKQVPDALPAPRAWQQQRLTWLLDAWSLEPADELIRIYRRTHRLLQDRLGERRFGEMLVAAESKDDQDTIDALCAQWPQIYARLQAMPLMIHNPALSIRGSWRVTEDGTTAVCLRWDQWGIEPLGCDPLLAERPLSEIDQALEPWRAQRGKDVEARQLVEVSLLFILDQALNRKQFHAALDAARRLLAQE
ncbi:MAG: hypothetical protein WCY71_06515 [Halothiobacillaceae bacterium]